MSETAKRKRRLLKAILEFDQLADLDAFFDDLCTPTEMEAMADRWHVVGLVEQGLPYRTINEKTGISTATITRVARCLTHGRGGYRRALAILQESTS